MMIMKNKIIVLLSILCIFSQKTVFSFALEQPINPTETTKVLMVVAHDVKQSLTYSLYDAISEFLATKNNLELLTLDLYDHAQEIPFYVHDMQQLEASPFFQQNKELILQADRLILFFPVYWYSTPGIVKAWIDLITRYAWQYKGGECAEPLHHITKVLSINSSIAKQPWYKFLLEHPVQRQITDTFKFMGVKTVKNYMIYDVYAMTPKLYSSHLENIKKLTEQLLV